MKSSITYIDLFAGASGLSEGFVRCGMTPLGHIEANTDASSTIKTRTAYHYLKQVNNLKDYNKYLAGEIDRNTLYSLVPKHLLDTVINAEIKKENLDQLFRSIDNSLKQHNRKNVDLIIGGPPCQAYSLIGRHRKDLADDPRNTLYLLYGRFLKYYQPKAFVFENVPGILSAGNSSYFDNLCRYYRKLGYEIHAEILNASDYGVLQDRKRVIIVGWKKEFDSGFPFPKNVIHQWDTENIFSDLPVLHAGEGKFYDSYRKKTNSYLSSFELRNGIETVSHHITRPHNSRDLDIYRYAIEKFNEGERLKYSDLPKKLRTHKNITAFLDRFKVVNGKGLSHTVVAHIAKDGHYYIHPDIEQCRSISIREAARLQSFPDDYYFEGSRTSNFTQIGNAVPPLMAEKIANGIKSVLQ